MTFSSGTPGLVRCGGNHSAKDLQRGQHGGQHLRQAPVLDGRECPERTHSLLADRGRHRKRMPQFRFCPATPWSSGWSFTSDRAGVPASPCCQYRGQSLAVSDGDGEGGMAQGAGWLDTGDGFAEGDAQAACTVSGHG